MKCCFSGRETPTDKLFVLYYPPTMAHQDWDKSVYAAARAGEAIREALTRLNNFQRRYVVGRKPLPGLLAGLAGVVLGAYWVMTATASWEGAGFFQRYLPSSVALLLLLFSFSRMRAFLRRSRQWRRQGRQTVAEEIQALQEEMAKMPEDPSAEQAAGAMRRRCPEIISELAFEGTYFQAFTYLDFVLFPELKNPGRREELPGGHSLNRDAYYVGDIVYDGWRLFHKDTREIVDHRFVGSGGRRGVL